MCLIIEIAKFFKRNLPDSAISKAILILISQG